MNQFSANSKLNGRVWVNTCSDCHLTLEGSMLILQCLYVLLLVLIEKNLKRQNKIRILCKGSFYVSEDHFEVEISYYIQDTLKNL